MKLIESLLDYLWSLREAKGMLKAPNTLLPFVVFVAVLAVWLFFCTFFTIPPISSVMVPVLEKLSGERSLHYPMHFILLPRTYNLLYLPFVILAGFVLFGRAVFAMADYYERMGRAVETRPPFAPAVPVLIGIGVVYVIFAGAPNLAATWLAAGLNNVWAGRLLGFTGLLVSLVAQVLLVYSLLVVRREGCGPVRAIRRSVSIGLSRFWPTLFVVFTIYLVHRPIDALLMYPDKVVLKFRPELVFFLLLGGVILELVTSFVLFASTTALALSRRDEGIGR
jgi:hypothetical protein